MPQTITYADVRRGWIDCDTCGDTLRIFYHHRCPICHTELTLPDAENRETDESEGFLSSGNGVEGFRRLLGESEPLQRSGKGYRLDSKAVQTSLSPNASQHPRFSEKPPTQQEERDSTPETNLQVRT